MHSLSHDSAIGYSSPPKIEHEISYQHLRCVHPVAHQFAKAVALIPGVQHLPHTSRKPKATPIGVVVSSVEEAVLATLEGLEEAIEDREEPPIFLKEKQVTLVILGSKSSIGGGGEGSGRGEGRDKPTDLDL